MKSIELFAGCGGLALGLARAGFQHAMVVELDKGAFATLSDNHSYGSSFFADWRLYNQDVSFADFSEIGTDIDLLAAGPPCQPFSIGGKHAGPEDGRNLWPAVVRAVHILRPKAFLFENVLGLLRPIWNEYLHYLRLSLSWPDFAIRPGEGWQTHYALLCDHMKAQGSKEPCYVVMLRGINMADYGVPQRRQRAIVLGIRADISAEWTFPEATHSQQALLWEQEVSGIYWARHQLSAPLSVPSGTSQDIRKQGPALCRRAWITVRDAIGDLPVPTASTEPLQGHRLHPGARSYARHTGSVWDEPAKTLKAGSHGVPGGENTLVLANGGVRYFTLREMARLQGFPDDFRVPSGWKHPIRQLGNAVPVQVGEVFGQGILHILSDAKHRLERAA
jgi:DNA (cytosine-5)-methyltransferase 1